MAISSPGIGSNLDVNGIVSQLMTIERQPLFKLQSTEASYQSKLSAVGSLKGALSSLQSAIGALTRSATFAGSYKASTSDSSVASASTSDKATSGSYSITVQQLAQAQKLRTSATYSSINSVVGSGKITVQFGTSSPDPTDLVASTTFTANADRPALEIVIDPSKNTLLDVRDAINKAGGGVTASIVNDGTGYRLSIVSTESGANNSLKISVADDDANHTDTSGLSTLAFDPTSTSRNLLISQNAKNALFSVDGIPIIKSSNSVSDAIQGVTLNLVKEGTTSVSVNFDRSGISGAVQSFVKAYNDANKQIRELGVVNTETKTVGPLQGDALVRTVQSQLRSALRGNLTYSAGGLTNLAEVGISFARDGSMTLDSAKLNAAVNNPAKDVSTLFAQVGKSLDSNISVLKSSANQSAGSYSVEISRLATQGKSISTISSLTVNAGVNDTFAVTVDDISTSITLSAGTYTLQTLSAEIQSKLNGASALKSAGSSVTAKASSVSELTGTAAVDLGTLPAGSFDLTIEGITKTISVNAGTSYASHDALVSDLQGKIESAFSGQAFTASVSHSGGALKLSVDGALAAPSVANGVSGNLFVAPNSAAGEQRLSITSSKYGSTSSVTAISSLLLGASTSTAGVDVAGKIAGVEAKGSGQELVAAGPATGVTLKVTGGALGTRSNIVFETGFAKRLDQMLSTLLGSKGSITGKTEGLQSSIKDLDNRREVLERRISQIEARYRKQFTALDRMMSQMTQTSTYLAQQLSKLPSAAS